MRMWNRSESRPAKMLSPASTKFSGPRARVPFSLSFSSRFSSVRLVQPTKAESGMVIIMAIEALLVCPSLAWNEIVLRFVLFWKAFGAKVIVMFDVVLLPSSSKPA